MKTRIITILLVATFSCFAASAQAQVKRIVIATAGTAGALYPMGVAMAETINRHVKGFSASAEASAGSLENLRNLSEGNVEWGISANEVAYMAFKGTDRYEGKAMPKLRSLFGTLLSVVQIFAPADSPLKSVADFKGKRIGMGAPGSGGELAGKKVLSYYGLDYKSVKPEFMDNPSMVSALKDGTLDAFIITHPLKSAALLDLTLNFKVKMIGVEDAGFYKKFPYYTKMEIPAGTYKNVDVPVPTPTSRIVMYTTTKMSAEDIYSLLKGVWENSGEWINVHASVKKYTSLKDALGGLGIPLHPGAVKYYKEKGMTVPDILLAK